MRAGAHPLELRPKRAPANLVELIHDQQYVKRVVRREQVEPDPEPAMPCARAEDEVFETELG